MASFRNDGPEAKDTPWLRGHVGGTILFAFRTVLDALSDRLREGVKLPFPNKDVPSALGYIGNDRNIERGPTQTHEGYAAQLQRAFDTWRNAGGARTILAQMRLYFAPGDGPPMRLVSTLGDSSASQWHVMNPSTGVVTKSVVAPPNWVWDANTTRWWRGWVILDGSGIWTLDRWGDPGDWGDGGTWGSNMSEGEAVSLRKIARKWKPAHVYVPQYIVTLDPTLFESTDASPPNPNGNGEDASWRGALDAIFLGPIGT